MPPGELFQLSDEDRAVIEGQRTEQAPPAPEPQRQRGIRQADPADFDDAAAEDAAEGAAEGDAEDAAEGDDDAELYAEGEDADADAEPQRRGDLGVALRRERDRNRELAGRLDQLQAMVTQLAGGQQVPRREAPPPPPQAPDPSGPALQELPDPSDDLDGYLAGVQRNQAATTDWIRAKQAHEAYQAQAYNVARQQAAAWEQHLVDREAAFARQRPDYNDAVQHLIGVYTQMTAASGIYDESRARAMATQALEQFAKQATAAQRDPAATLYGMAKAAGFQSRQKGQVDKPRRASAAARAEGRLSQRHAAPARGDVVDELIDASVGDHLRAIRSIDGPDLMAALRKEAGGRAR